MTVNRTVTVGQQMAQAVQRWLFPLGVLPGLYVTGMAWRASSIDGGVAAAKPVELFAKGTGSWALYFLLLTLLVTPLRRLLAAGWLLRLRRPLGLLSFVYACLHMAAWLLQQGTAAGEGIGSNLLRDVTKRPYIVLGAVAYLGLVPLAVTSTQGMIRRLGRRWTTLHRLVYGCAFLSVVHFTWQAKDGSVRALLCAALWLLLMGLRLVSWARALHRVGSEDPEGR